MTTLTAETLAELERLRGALDCPSDFDLGANNAARWAWNQATLEHFPALIAAARERNDFSELLDDKIDKLDFAIEDADRNWKRAITAETELTATRRALRLAQGILDTLEWIQDENGDEHCPSCGSSPGIHSNDCELALVMRERMAADSTAENG